MKATFLSFALSSLTVLTLASLSEAAKAETLDVSLSSAAEPCGSESQLMGRSFALQTRSHGTKGNVKVLDDCTLEISDFIYDGKGRQVEFYNAIEGKFVDGQALSVDLLRPSKPYINDTLTLRLPVGLNVDTLEGISLWCTDAAVSFGDVFFKN